VSLINDALKRAGEKPASVPSTSELTAGLQPADERRSGFPVVVLLTLLIPVIGLGLWFLVKGMQMNEPAKPVPIQVVIARTPEPVPARTNVPVVTPSPPTPAQPAYKLQGIYWRPSRAAAVVNGKTLYVGDQVDKARIASIDKDSVTLDVDGQSKVLQLH
jgi:hypothetical protein